MANRLKGITVEINGDTTGLDKALKNVNKTIKDTSSQLKDVNKLLKLDPGNAELMAQKQRLLTDAVSETRDKLQALKEASVQANEALSKGDISQAQYDALQREIIATEQSLKDLEKQAEQSSVAMQKIAATGENLKNLGSKVTGVGTALTKGVTAPIVAIGAASTAAFNEVDAGLDIVVEKTGATGKALEEMQDIVKNMATEIPTDFETAGAAVGEVNTRFGLTGDALEELSTKFVKFAALNDTDVSSSIDNVSSVLNAFNMSTEDAGAMLDVLNSVGQSTGLSMDELSSRLYTNAAQFQELGYDAAQSAQFLGMVEMAGVDTSAAMMGLKTAMKNATADGITLEQSMANFTAVMSSNASETEKLQAAYDMFGSRAGGALYNAFQSGKISLEDLQASMTDFAGNVDSTFEGTLDPIDKWQMALNSLKVAGAEIGATLYEVLAPALEVVTSAVKSFAEFWSGIPEPMQRVIVTIGLIAAAVGPLLVAIGSVISAVGTIMTLVPALSGALTALKGVFIALNAAMAANPIGIVIVAITALVAAFLYLWNNCEAFRDFWINLFEKVKEVVSKAVEAVKNFFTKMIEGIKERVGKIKETIVGGFTAAIDFITSLPRKALKWGKDIIEGIVRGIKSMIGAVKNAVSSVANTIKSFLHFSTPDEGPLKDYASWMPDMMKGLAEGISSNTGLIDKAIAGVASSIQDGIGGDLAVNAIADGTVNNTMTHSGTIRVEGVNSNGQLQDVVNIVVDQLYREVRMA